MIPLPPSAPSRQASGPAARRAAGPPTGSAEGVRVAVVEDLRALEEHAPAWDALIARLPAGSILPHASHAWMTATLEHKLDADERWRCYLAYEGDALLGVLPLARRPDRLLGRARPRLRVPWEHYTKNGDAVLDPGREDEALRALLREVGATEGPHLELRLGGIRAGDRTTGAFHRAASGWSSVEPDRDGRLVRIEGTWDAWAAPLRSNFRRSLRKSRNRLDAATQACFRFLTGNDATPGHLGPFLALEASGWKGERGDAVLRSPAAEAFYRTLVRRLAARGWLEWHLLEIDGRLAAGHLAVRCGRTRTLVRIAYDESRQRLSPGNALFHETLRRTFDQGDADVLDCISDQPWHDRWRMERVPYRALVHHPRSPLALALGVFPHRARRVAAHLAQRFRA